MPHTKITALDRLLTDQRNDDILKEISSLPDTYRTVIMLRYYEGFKIKEITEATGIPNGTIKAYSFRGKRMLRDRLGKSLRVPVSYYFIIAWACTNQ